MSHASLLVALPPHEDTQAALASAMAPFDENGKWFREGSRWDYWSITNYLGGQSIVRKDELDLVQLREYALAKCRKRWEKAQSKSEDLRELIYGVQPTETLKEYLIRTVPESGFPAHYAFLDGQRREWHERDRLGWWGGTAKTECKLADDGHTGKCIHECGETGARIISWGDDPKWGERFWDRFVRQLPDDTVLVSVDYHV